MLSILVMQDYAYAIFLALTLAFLTWLGCQAYQFVDNKILTVMEVSR